MDVCAEACAAWPVCLCGRALPVNDAAYWRAIDVCVEVRTSGRVWAPALRRRPGAV